MKNLIILILFLLLAQAAFATDKVVLTERLIKTMIGNKPPSVQQIEASFLSSKKEELSKNDELSFRLEAEGQSNKSKERLLSNFDGGVVSNSTSYSVGVVKPTRYGIDLGLKTFAGKSSNAFISDAATKGVSFNLSMDLYQNFLGRKTSNNLKRTELGSRRAKLIKKASLKTFESNTRKLYWALVANNEQKILLSSLVKSAKKQYQQSVRRKKSGVADSGEVARYHSQWTTRQASFLSLRYQRGEILKSLKAVLPELNGKDVVLGPYSVDAAIGKVLACSATIRSYPTAPFKFTPYDEIVDFLNQEEKLERKVSRTYDDPKIKLYGEYASVGRDFGLEAAGDDFDDDARARTSVGLKISIPFGGRKKETRQVIEKLQKNRYQAESRGNLSKIKAYHSETAEIISILKEVVKNQKQTNKYLAQSLKVSKKKYKQARISVQELISEQDSLLNSKLNEIQTNLTIINTLMDYFSIYTDIPCALNRI